MLNKLKTLLSITDDDQPRFRGWEDTPGCGVYLVGDSILLFMGMHQGTSNHYLTRLDLPCDHVTISKHLFDCLAAASDPGPGGTAGDPPYYVVAAGMKDERKYHKATSMISIQWIKKPHCTGDNPANWKQGITLWAPGIYLNPMRRLRSTGSFEGLGNDYNRGPIPPEDHERIGRELLELFEIIRTDFDRGPLPRRAQA